MKKLSKGRWWIAGVAAILAGAFIFRLKSPTGPSGVAEAKPAHESAHDEAPASSRKPRVSVVKPSEGAIARTASQPGTMESFDFADLYAKVSGYLEKQELQGKAVDIGTKVKRGDVLAVIDMPELHEELHRAIAAHEQSIAEVDQSLAREETAKEDFNAAVAAIKLAEEVSKQKTSYAKFRKIQYDRISALYNQKAIDQRLVDEKMEELDSSLAAESAAKQAIVSAQAQANAAKARISQAQADIVDARARVKVAKALADKAQVFVNYTKIISPYDGVVTKRNFHVGDFIRAADQGQALPLFTVARTDKMRIIMPIPDRYVPYTNEGDRAIVEVDALAGSKFPGTVARFSNSEDRVTRTMRVEIDLENPGNKLRDGMYGRVTIFVDEGAKGLTVPSSSLIADTKTKKFSVYVVRDGKLQKTQVEVGQEDGKRTEIVSGLTASDTIVRSPTGELSDGMAVDAELPSETVAESSSKG